MKDKMTPEMRKADQAKQTTEELKTLAAAYGLTLRDDEAARYYNALCAVALSDDELGDVSAGGNSNTDKYHVEVQVRHGHTSYEMQKILIDMMLAALGDEAKRAASPAELMALFAGRGCVISMEEAVRCFESLHGTALSDEALGGVSAGVDSANELAQPLSEREGEFIRRVIKNAADRAPFLGNGNLTDEMLDTVSGGYEPTLEEYSACPRGYQIIYVDRDRCSDCMYNGAFGFSPDMDNPQFAPIPILIKTLCKRPRNTNQPF